MCLHSAVAVEELSLSPKRKCKGGRRMTKKKKLMRKSREEWLFAAIHAHSVCTSLHRLRVRQFICASKVLMALKQWLITSLINPDSRGWSNLIFKSNAKFDLVSATTSTYWLLRHSHRLYSVL